MADSKLKVDIRRKSILDELRQNGKVYVTELSRTLNVTPVTIRNDLDALEENGQLIRMNGGAIWRGGNSARLGQTSIAGIAQAEEKIAIAKAIADMIEDGDTLFINSGTTSQLIAAALKDRSNLNIVTNSLAVAVAFEHISSFRVIMLGGELNTKYGFTYGSDAQEKLVHYHADWAILSVDGISFQNGITTYHAEEALIDQMMINGASQVLIAVDHTKIGHAGFMKVCDCTPRIQVVTDRYISSAAHKELLENGITVIECD